MQDRDTTLQQLKERIHQFNHERNWLQSADAARGVASSIAIEAAELLEHYQWSDQPHDREGLKQELADVIIYCLALANLENIDLAAAINKKIAHNRKKFPAEIFQKGWADHENYLKVKKLYRKTYSPPSS